MELKRRRSIWELYAINTHTRIIRSRIFIVPGDIPELDIVAHVARGENVIGLEEGILVHDLS